VKEKERVGLGESGFYDRDIYDSCGNKYNEYVTSIAVSDEMEVRNNLWILKPFYYQLMHIMLKTQSY